MVMVMFYVVMFDLFSLAKSQHSQGVGSTFFFPFAVYNPGPSARFRAFEESQLAEVWARPLGGMMLFMSFYAFDESRDGPGRWMTETWTVAGGSEAPREWVVVWLSGRGAT